MSKKFHFCCSIVESIF